MLVLVVWYKNQANFVTINRYGWKILLFQCIVGCYSLIEQME